MSTQKKTKKSSSPKGRRAGNIGGMVNTTIQTIIGLFLMLSDDARRSLLVSLNRLAGGEAPAGSQNSEAGTVPKESGSPGKVSKSKLCAWDRPVIRTLPAAKRQSGRSKTDRNSDEGKADGKLISAAIAALNRAVKQSISDTDKTVLSELDDLVAIKALWPRQLEIVQDPPNQNSGEESSDNDMDSEVTEATEETNVFLAEPGTSIPDGEATVTLVTGIQLVEFGKTDVDHRLVRLTNPQKKELFPGATENSPLSISVHDRALARMTEKAEVSYKPLRRYAFYRTSDGIVILRGVPVNWSEMETPPAKKRKKTPLKST